MNNRQNYLTNVVRPYSLQKKVNTRQSGKSNFWFSVGQCIPWGIAGYFIGTAIGYLLVGYFIILPIIKFFIEIIQG
ncbi:hypothetical protein ACFL20_09400 [Spirochaetota bacterium]